MAGFEVTIEVKAFFCGNRIRCGTASDISSTALATAVLFAI
jgi:hypothetical protein